MHLQLIATTFQDNGYETLVIGNGVAVSLLNRTVSSIELIQILMRHDMDEICNVSFSYAHECPIVTVV